MVAVGHRQSVRAHHATETRVGRRSPSGEQDRRSWQERSMAPRKSSQRRSVSAAGEANAGISTADIVGTYAYKFSGYVMLQLRPWWLTGLGKFAIEAPNAVGTAKVAGEHRSSVMVL